MFKNNIKITKQLKFVNLKLPNYFCRFGAVLAKIESQKENYFLSKLVAKPQRSVGASFKTEYWIGLFYICN